jgi:hypothetical protein
MLRACGACLSSLYPMILFLTPERHPVQEFVEKAFVVVGVAIVYTSLPDIHYT